MKRSIIFIILILVILQTGCIQHFKIAYYMKRFNTDDEKILQSTANYIAKEFGKEAVPELVTGLNHMKESYRVGSAMAVAIIKSLDPKIMKILKYRSIDDNSQRVRFYAGKAMAEISHDKKTLADLESCYRRINDGKLSQKMKIVIRDYKIKLRTPRKK